jgi:GTP-binding protein HflX
MTDTVGFIRKLPHQLVDAFGATLEETTLADLVLHVVDASADEDELLAMMRSVEDTLEEIGAGERPRLLVLNKVDALDAEGRAALRHRHPHGIGVSALTGEGLDELREAIEQAFARTLTSVELLLPYSEGGRLAELHDVAGELHREDTADGVRVVARLPAAVADRYARFALNGARADSAN